MSIIDIFLDSPTFDGLVKLKKDNILEIGLRLELEVRWSM